MRLRHGHRRKPGVVGAWSAVFAVAGMGSMAAGLAMVAGRGRQAPEGRLQLRSTAGDVFTEAELGRYARHIVSARTGRAGAEEAETGEACW